MIVAALVTLAIVVAVAGAVGFLPLAPALIAAVVLGLVGVLIAIVATSGRRL